MAATETKQASNPIGDAILMAALALPGIGAPLAAQAETAPDKTTISLKYLDYRDKQPDLDRVAIRSPALELLVPVAGNWSLQANAVADAVSGASPRYHSAVSGASRFEENRNGQDITVTRYHERGSLSFGMGRSRENDYKSRFYSSQASYASEDKNTTWLFGIGVTRDTINPVNRIVKNERKNSTEVMLGLTQVLGTHDIAQAVYTHTRGRGYYSDPYKLLDNRPRSRDQDTLLLRWNHHFEASQGSNRLSYRYYTDSFGIRAHTLNQEYAQPLSNGWSITPSLRLYSQSKANFYFDPVYDSRFGEPFPKGYVFSPRPLSSADQRLSGFGAVTFGLKVEKEFAGGWIVDLKWETYTQRGSWALFGKESLGLEKFSARSWQFGVSKSW